jgi:hypothetical protein
MNLLLKRPSPRPILHPSCQGPDAPIKIEEGWRSQRRCSLEAYFHIPDGRRNNGCPSPHPFLNPTQEIGREAITAGGEDGEEGNGRGKALQTPVTKRGPLECSGRALSLLSKEVVAPVATVEGTAYLW